MKEGLPVQEFANAVGVSEWVTYKLLREGVLTGYKCRESRVLRVTTDPKEFKERESEFKKRESEVVAVITTIVHKNGKIRVIRATSVVELQVKLKKL